MATAAHANKWTVAIDPPPAAATITLFDTQAEAEVAIAILIARGQRDVYVLPPVAAWGGRPSVGA